MEIDSIDPDGRFHESLIWVLADDTVQAGQKYENGVFSDVLTEPVKYNKDQVEAFRLIAYADPITGSDRYFSESMALQACGFSASSAEVKEVKSKGVDRKAEIKALYPYPTE